LRILYILTTLGIGGAEKQVITLAECMAAQGHTVALMSLKHADEEWPVKLPVLRLNLRKTPVGIARGLRFAKNFLAAFQPDILHSHTFPANIFTRLLALTLRFRGTVPVVVNTIHNVHEGGWHRMLLYCATDPLADRVTAVSAAASERFIRLHAVSRKKISVLTNGIDVDEFTPDRTRRKTARTQMQIEREFVWLAVGRLAPAKDYPNLLRAFAKVRSARPETCIWIAGEGDTSPFAAGSVEAQLTSGVHFLGLRRDIASLLDAADGFVLSSAWEGMPLAVGEAMAMEKLIVATDVGGVRELLGECGIVVAPRDSEAIAAAMLQAMSFVSGRRKAMGKQARERIRLHFSMHAKASEWQQLYAQCLHEKRS
jgi:glycosyltransferase involved in cell wall biosynthesis